MSPPVDRQAGTNGVAIPERVVENAQFRTYEVYQRERVGQSTEKINGIELANARYVEDPYTPLRTLRENYPCYRDWINNSFWITRYNDVTSVFADEANFESRSKLWYYGMEKFGTDFWSHVEVQWAWSNAVDAEAGPVALELASGKLTNLATQFAALLPIKILARALGIASDDFDKFATLYWQAQRGYHWQGQAQTAGRKALSALAALFDAKLLNGGAQSEFVKSVSELGGTAPDLVTTVIERDHETLHGGVANLLFHLFTNDGTRRQVAEERRLLKIATLETLRHSPPVITAQRFARHEVERFGRLIPRGALLRLSALAANRDPRIFAEADTFIAQRRDICHREARGQYRADGLPQGISFGTGRPSIHPAVPEDRPRSTYALTRDAIISAVGTLLTERPDLRLAAGAPPAMRCLSINEMYACWQLPVTGDQP